MNQRREEDRKITQAKETIARLGPEIEKDLRGSRASEGTAETSFTKADFESALRKASRKKSD